MKRTTLFITSLVLIVGCSKPEPVDYSQLVQRDNIYYIKNSIEPYSGPIVGQLLGNSKNGKLQGETIYFHQNGQLSKKGVFKDGIPFGKWKYFHTDGEETIEIEKSIDGDWISYHDNGKVYSRGNIEGTNFDGDWIYYNDDGVLSQKIKWKDGNKLTDRWYSDGKPDFEYFYNFGFKTNDIGLMKMKFLSLSKFYLDGLLFSTTQFKDGKVSSSTHYDEYRRIVKSNTHNNGELVSSTERLYNDDGGYLMTTIDFEKNKTILSSWDKDGNIIKIY